MNSTARLFRILAGLVLLAAASPLVAQVPEVREKDAYLGVSLAEQCFTPPENGLCDSPPIIRSVVIGGPADIAGVRTGDVLVSIDGTAVTTTEGRDALYGLRREVPVDLGIVREGVTVELAVVPAPLPSVRRVRFIPGPPTPRSDGVDIRTMTIHESDAGETGFTVEIETGDERVGDLRGAHQFVVVQTDSTGNTMVRVDAPTAVVAGSESEADAVAYSWRYVLRDSELVDRLQAVQRMARVGARARIDSLMLIHGVMRMREGERPASDGAVWVQSGEVSPIATVSPGDLERIARTAPAPDVRRLFESRNRAAGAEFQVLTPQLAEYFPGAEAGLLVLRVIPGTPAAHLGLLQGDVLVEIGGEAAVEMSLLQNALTTRAESPGLAVKWIRKGSELTGTLANP